MSNDAHHLPKCSNAAAALTGYSPTVKIPRRDVDGDAARRATKGASFEDPLRRCRRAAAIVLRIFAMALALAWTTPSLAEPPKSGNTKAESGSASKSSGAGRSKPTPPPAAPPPLKSEPEGPEAEGKARAQAIFEQAVAAYKEGRYFDAIELFLETNRIYPDSKLCFNVARAYEGLGNSAGALRYYREYLRRTPAAADRADVEASVRQLELALSQKGVQQMTVSSSPDGAVLSIDGHPVALTPWTGETWPGKHRVSATHPGYVEAQQVVELAPHRSIDVQIDLQPEPPPRPATAPASEQRAEGRGVEVLTVVTLAASAVLLGSALAVELSHSESGLSSTAAFLGGAGVGAAAVGGVLFYFDLSGARSK